MAWIWCWHAGITNYHYDGVAHLNIARLVFDHQHPSLRMLGTIWLPLQHLLLIPLVQIDYFWRTGLAGSLISLGAFWLACHHLFSLALLLYPHRCAGWLALLCFLLNPNLLYLQSTPLGEMLYIACSLGFTHQLCVFLDNGRQRALLATAAYAALASLARYDGWALVLWGGMAALGGMVLQRRSWQKTLQSMASYGALAGVGIGAWLVYNWRVYGDPLAFLKGEYSTQARIVRILAEAGLSQYAPFHNLGAAWMYYREAILISAGTALFKLGCLGFGLYLLRFCKDRKLPAWGFLFFFPPFFYIYNMTRGTGIIYVPAFPPYGLLNVRYTSLFFPALCLFLPAVALLAGQLAGWLRGQIKSIRPSPLFGQRVELTAGLLLLATVGWQCAGQLGKGPNGVAFCEEAYLNGVERRQAEFKMAAFLHDHYDGAPILMDISEHGLIPQQAGISLVHFINQSAYDLWVAALERPSAEANWIVVEKSDAIWQRLAQSADLRERFMLLAEFQSPFEAPLRVYKKK